LVKLQYAFDKKEYGRVREWLLMLCKRRGQAKKAVVDMIDLVTNTFLEKLPTREEKFTFLQSLREACEGKMFLEREYENCTRRLIEMLEQDGKTDEAALTIQEIQIETYGSLENKEKVDFILYQMKLVLMRNDFVRLQILSRKISKKAINEKGLEAQKVQYFTFMLKYYIHEKELMEAAKAYLTIFETYAKADDEYRAKIEPSYNIKMRNAFQNYLIYLLISPYNDEKV
jgi:26S proteasome regulatory subunit N5